MSIVAVDLAAKFSAAVWTDEYKIISQWDSWQSSEADFVSRTCQPFTLVPAPIALVVEDLPARVPWMTTVKNVCRLQGRIVERMDRLDRLDKVLFLQPAQWRDHFGPAMKNGTGPDVVVPVAARYGYQPPSLEHRMAPHKKYPGRPAAGEKAIARKVATDYCAAYLIGRWATDMWNSKRDLDRPRTSRYLCS